jgi:hypothetical protein
VLIPEIADALKTQGLLEKDAAFTTSTKYWTAWNGRRRGGRDACPPLDVAALRQEWQGIREAARSLQPSNLPSRERISGVWSQLKAESARQNRSVFETSSMMALSAARSIPDGVRWLSASAVVGATRTGHVFAAALLDHYKQTLSEYAKPGMWSTPAVSWVRISRPPSSSSHRSAAAEPNFWWRRSGT